MKVIVSSSWVSMNSTESSKRHVAAQITDLFHKWEQSYTSGYNNKDLIDSLKNVLFALSLQRISPD